MEGRRFGAEWREEEGVETGLREDERVGTG
jgi:hypothetical protein